MQFPLTVAGIGSVAVGLVLFFLYRRIVGGRMNQAFREAGPESHKQKGKVPTGAGLVFVLCMLLLGSFLVIEPASRSVAYVCFASVLMGLLGFIDDRSKVLGGSAGLKARFKLPAMILTGLVLLYLIHHSLPDVPGALDTTGLLPGAQLSFAAGLPVWLYYLLGLFIWLGAMNGSNFTDGLDGLLGTSSLASFLAMLVVLPMFATSSALLLPVAVCIGLLIAFLSYNWKPASIYMGDSGSLCIGALAAGIWFFSGEWLYLGLFAFIWVVEVLSVMLQVVYFRRTGGKRLFLMTPIHHHFELAGWKETTVVYVFAALQAWGCLSAWLWLKLGLLPGLLSSLLLFLTFVFLVLRYRTRVA
ncbi:MAG: phospho-N-acetylmuramoyl-pentapeptide-transferase [bacterium]